MRYLAIASLLLPLVLASSGRAAADDQPSPTETRLRDALRNTMLQERDAQNQIITLQAAQAQSAKDNADLKAQVDKLTTQIAALAKQGADDRTSAAATITGQKTQIADLNTQLQKFSDALKAWKADDAAKTTLAANKEAARAQLAGDVITLQRLVVDREQKNLALFDTGNEILTRYEKFSLGDALAAKEPFVGLTRVKLEELVQDYRDKLLNHVVTTPGVLSPGAPVQSPAPATASAAKP
jgi:hypothetical protein